MCGLRVPAGAVCDVVLDFVREDDNVRLDEVTDAARMACVFEGVGVIETAEEQVAV